MGRIRNTSAIRRPKIKLVTIVCLQSKIISPGLKPFVVEQRAEENNKLVRIVHVYTLSIPLLQKWIGTISLAQKIDTIGPLVIE